MDDTPTMMNSSTSFFCNSGHGFQKQCKSKQLNISFTNSQDLGQWQNSKKYSSILRLILTLSLLSVHANSEQWDLIDMNRYQLCYVPPTSQSHTTWYIDLKMSSCQKWCWIKLPVSKILLRELKKFYNFASYQGSEKLVI